jgi:glycosyltransferase involved in cell wall biosynthesis
VHAPIAPESNQLMLARAGAGLGVPMVIAGPVADPAYAERLREFAPVGVTLLGEPSAEVLGSLYRAAAVVADAAWTPRGHGRLATAAAFGTAVVCSQARWLDLPDLAQWTVDPADVRAIARGIGEAWDGAVRGDTRIQATARFARERLETAAASVVASYARIVQEV